jgi:hypothetical protein
MSSAVTHCSTVLQRLFAVTSRVRPASLGRGFANVAALNPAYSPTQNAKRLDGAALFVGFSTASSRFGLGNFVATCPAARCSRRPSGFVRIGSTMRKW